ncbi:hypothetical protein FVE85_7095 [Porphyridium purpureum]|uniref:Uncharacterized protein n=1 Tax=Porphyridium purpureum TaxID=35688 RepID=A0A5J4Z8S9_PORPP|nr:hypothetical protein FVE85_7095 [Porphyridium purpureum]|eukprot:POR3670..scf295_1
MALLSVSLCVAVSPSLKQPFTLHGAHACPACRLCDALFELYVYVLLEMYLKVQLALGRLNRAACTSCTSFEPLHGVCGCDPSQRRVAKERARRYVSLEAVAGSTNREGVGVLCGRIRKRWYTSCLCLC